jgi:hypothetical protein
MPSIKRLIPVLAALGAAAGLAAPNALASTTQEALIQDDAQLQANLAGTLQTMQTLGATRVKFSVAWAQVAPDATSHHAPTHFNATDPAAYPAGNWSFLDSFVRQAKADGLQVALMVTSPAPVWAEGPGVPAGYPATKGNWKPSASAYQAFMTAIGKRYGGSYAANGASTPLPRVSWWSIWNEPNYGPDLAPQAIDHDTVEVGAAQYRALLNAGWRGLAASGHHPGSDTILLGETAPRGLDHPIGNFSGVKPLRFLRALYCVNAAFRPLRGTAASLRGCPTTAAGSRAFRGQNPALFQASGYAAHPYAQHTPPNVATYGCTVGGTQTFCSNAAHRSDPDYADLAEIGRLERTLDHLNRVYGSHTTLPIWNTEYGYWTNPPDASSQAINATLAAYYLNWAEYLSYTQPRIGSYSQYLLRDPANGKFAAGLELPNGTPKLTFAAYRTPLFMPATTAGHATSLTVWGALRGAGSLLTTTSLQPQAKIQFHPGSHGAFTTLRTVTVANPRGYFTTTVPFTQSGSVRIAWSPGGGATVYSRTQAIKVG